MEKIQSIDYCLEAIKDCIGIEFGETVKGREIKGYHNGSKIYLDGINCLELAEIFLTIAYHLEAVDSNFNKAVFAEAVKERLHPILEVKQ